MLRFFPVPDPNFPHTMTRENINNAQTMGILQNSFGMYVAANLEMFGEDSKGGALETLPNDILTIRIPTEVDGKADSILSRGKFWVDRYNVPSRYVYFDRGVSPFLPASIRSIQVSSRHDIAGGFSDPSFEIYNQRCAQFYREFADLMNAWGGVPALKAYDNTLGEATKRLSFVDDEQGNTLPSIAIPLRVLPGDGTGLGELVFRFNPDNGCVEFFSPQEFFQAIREKKFNVQAEIARLAKKKEEEPAPVGGGSGSVGSGSGGGGIILHPPVAVTAPPAAPPASEGLSHWEGLEINNSTGEAIVNGLQTGLYFERPAQILPRVGGNVDVDRTIGMVSPLSYATNYTATSILAKLQERLPGWKLGIVMADQKDNFPVSVLARHVGVTLENGHVLIVSNFGLIAQTIARTTAEVSDGQGGTKKVQNWSQALDMAVGEITRAVEEYQRKLQ